MKNISLKKIIFKSRIKLIIENIMGSGYEIIVLDEKKIPLMGTIHSSGLDAYEVMIEDKTLGWILCRDRQDPIVKAVIYMIETEINQKILAADALDKYEELNFLYDISAKIATCLDVNEVIELMANEALKEIPGNTLTVMLYQPEEQKLQSFYSHNHEIVIGQFLNPHKGIYGEVFKSGKAEIVNQVTSDPRFVPQDFAIASLMCVPLITQKGNLGVIQITSDRPIQYTAQDLKLFTALASQAAASIQNALFYQQLEEYSRTLEIKVAERTEELEKLNQELNRLANLDGLTKVANRRRFEEVFKQEWYRLAREKSPLSIIVCDVDYFKRYNDTYGHQMGDECLQKIAQTIDKILKRPADLVARYGGEEFVVLLPNTKASGAWMIAQEIQKQVRQLGIEHEASLVSSLITISMGISAIIPNHEISGEEFFEIADQALYAAKKQGRDRMVFRQFDVSKNK